MFGLFYSIFDFDQNGKIDILEQAVEFEIFNNIMNENDKKTISIDKDFELEDKD